MNRDRARRRLVLAGTLVLLTLTAAACSSSPSPQAVRPPPAPRATTTLPPAATASSTASPQSTQPVAAPAGATTSPPASIAANCSTDVSRALHKWFKSLPSGSTVVMHPGSCYLVNEGIKLKNAQGLTVDGGEFKIATVLKDQQSKAARDRGNAVFWLIGGSHVTFEGTQIVGANQGGYHPHLAFEAGIRSDGVDGLTISHMTATNVYGDGIELNVLRGAQDDSGTIIRPSENVTVTDVTVDGAGRTGISIGGADHVSLSDIHLARIGINDFDLEADQGNEGARNVTIDGCTADGAKGAFFANGGAGYGAPYDADITVSNCTMEKVQAGFAIYIATVAKSPDVKGPITFKDDHLICGDSVYVACVDVTGGKVTISDSSFSVPPGYGRERIYSAKDHTTLAFEDVTASGYRHPGKADSTSTVSVTGGHWETVKK